MTTESNFFLEIAGGYPGRHIRLVLTLMVTALAFFSRDLERITDPHIQRR